jgi:glycosyltransferase involved in cell wall biosynthesis
VSAHVVRQGILFVGHDAARAGAQIELLHFLRWFKLHGTRPFSILLGAGGELVPDFEELANTWSSDRSHWHPSAHRANLLVALGLGSWASRAEAVCVRKFAAKVDPVLIYTNSIASARIIDVLAPQLPVLTHVHELESNFRAPSQALTRLLKQTRQFITCSNATAENLVNAQGIAPNRIETVHESIPVDQIRAERTREQVLQELQIPQDAQIVLGCGTLCWRKGTDLFIHLARWVCQQRDRAYFVWIGGGSVTDMAQVQRDVRLSSLTGKIRFTGPVTKPYDYMAAAEIFVLTSREDPYPLVGLEAAALKKPIVCFAGAGGMKEFIEEDCGFVVPYLDIMAMADRIISLLDKPEYRRSLGEAARQKVEQRHDIRVAGPQIMQIIERTVAGGREAC